MGKFSALPVFRATRGRAVCLNRISMNYEDHSDCGVCGGAGCSAAEAASASRSWVASTFAAASKTCETLFVNMAESGADPFME